ncbi:MAG: GTPase, partial [Promethearchaeota archaeon]
IIGYTNAGKSTFLNRLAKSGVKTANQEFTTVSTTSRKVTFPRFDNYGNWKGEDVIFTDSVGFITDMSQILIDAFLSTLEELKFSNLLVIVIDIAEPDIARIWTKISTSFQIIEKIGATEIPKLFVFNKIDLVTPTKCENRIKTIHEQYISIPYVSISALEKKGFERLAKEIIAVKHQYFSKKPVKF